MRIDHVSVAGRDLKALSVALERAGIHSEYGGPHANHATEMAIASFADGSYLELIALQPAPDKNAVAMHDWSVQIQNNAGPTAWAIQVPSIDEESKRLAALQVRVSRPERSGRTRPDGVDLKWETAQIGEEPRGTFFPFLIRDFTPREQRAFPSGKATASGVRGISRVVIATRNLAESAARFQKAYGWAAPFEQEDTAFGARIAVFRGTPIVLSAPLNAQSWIADRLQKFGEGPCAFILRAPQTALHSSSKTRWAGVQISWLDEKILGWHLGFE